MSDYINALNHQHRDGPPRRKPGESKEDGTEDHPIDDKDTRLRFETRDVFVAEAGKKQQQNNYAANPQLRAKLLMQQNKVSKTTKKNAGQLT